MRIGDVSYSYGFRVTPAGYERVSVGTVYSTTLPAPARPRVPDPVQHVAPKLSRRLLDAYGADCDSVQGHECISPFTG